jgi:hypothetical protein
MTNNVKSNENDEQYVAEEGASNSSNCTTSKLPRVEAAADQIADEEEYIDEY